MQCRREHPNLWVKLEGRTCLLWGAVESYAKVQEVITALGGRVVSEKISRVDLCVDIPGLDVRELQEAVERGQFITRANHVKPQWDLARDQKTGFIAGKAPLYLTVYDKAAQLMGRGGADYAQAMIDRRWSGEAPKTATRVEFQCGRRWLLEQGVSSAWDFFGLQGAIAEKLTQEWFRVTDQPVDRENRNQSRAKTLPLWVTVQAGFRRVFGEPEGELVPIQRDKIEPFRLIKQGRGCLRNALLQMGFKCETYGAFAEWCRWLLLRLAQRTGDYEAFIEDYKRRQTEHLS